MRCRVRQLACLLMLVASLGASAATLPATRTAVSAQALTRLIGALSQQADVSEPHAAGFSSASLWLAADTCRTSADQCSDMQPAAAHSAAVQSATSLGR